jgi:hypothetical protein
VFRHDFGRCPLDHTVLAVLERDFLVDTTVADRYVIERLVGEGGMGRVYRARHRNLDRLFAVKVLYGDLAADAKMRLRFEREARAASRVDHPHLVSVLDFGITDSGLLYLVMSYVEGRELGEIIEDEAPLSPERVQHLVRQLCQGLAHAHDLGLVHRDFKGQNVLVSGKGADEHARILDFGLAFMREEPDSSRLTTEGVVMGTPAYMSPEQATGQALDHRTDLFSLGVLIYEMLAGKLPFDGTPVELARQNLAADPPAIAARVPGLVVDRGLERIAHRLMQKLPADRLQSAHEVIAALDMLAAEDQDTHSVPALPALPARSGAAQRRAGTGGRAGGGKAAAAVDAIAATESMDQREVSAPVPVRAATPPMEPAVTQPMKPAAAPPVVPAVTLSIGSVPPVAPPARPLAKAPAAAPAGAPVVTPPVEPAAAQDAPAPAEQSARARKPVHGTTALVRGTERPRRAVALVAVLALSAAVVIALLVWRSARNTELAATTPETAASAPAEVAEPAPAEVAAPPPAEVAPAPAEVAAPAPAEGPAAPGSRSPESRRSRRDRNTAGPSTGTTGSLANPPAGTKEPDTKEPAAAASAAADLEALYKRVGQKLDAFERERGAAAARPLWDSYSAIPLLDALRTPSLGQDAMRTLRRIERDMDAARSAP